VGSIGGRWFSDRVIEVGLDFLEVEGFSIFKVHGVDIGVGDVEGRGESGEFNEERVLG